jgi:signal transduction histidine kinase
MNYEELLESRNGAAMAKQPLPFGWMHKKLLEGKYVNVVDLRDDLKDSLVFTDALVTEAEQNKTLTDSRQIHFTTLNDSAGLYGVAVEGHFRTYAQLLAEQPAIVAQKNFINNTIKADMKSFDADSIIKAGIDKYMSESKKKTVTLIYENPGRHFVFADRKMTETVIDNLLSNAVKYTPHGGDIIVDVKNYEEDPEHFLLINVYDTGSGLTSAQSESIFDDKNKMAICFSLAWVA